MCIIWGSIVHSSYIHWKLLVGWLVIILLDTMADFRLELIYPAFMFARSVYDSYKYQGLVCCSNTAHTHYIGRGKSWVCFVYRLFG